MDCTDPLRRDRLRAYAKRLADYLCIASDEECEAHLARVRAGLSLRALPWPWRQARGRVLTLRKKRA